MSPSQLQWNYDRLLSQGHIYREPSVKNPFKYLTAENQDKLSKYSNPQNVVYFFYDVNGILLYVGRTINFVTRWKDHLNSSKDMCKIESVCLHVFGTKQEMLFYEIQKINELKPLWNVADTEGSVSPYDMKPLEINWFSCEIPTGR